MEFAFDDQQLEFRSQLRAFLERECTPEDVRAAFGGPPGGPAAGPATEHASGTAHGSGTGQGPDRRRWKQLAEMGVVGLTAPESEGGLGLGAVDLVGLLEVSGRAALPEPLAENTALALPLLADIASPEAWQSAGTAGAEGGAGTARVAARVAARDWLRPIASGEAIATIVSDPSEPSVWADRADVLIVVDSERILLARADEVDVTPVGSIDPTRRLAKVTLREGMGVLLCDGAASHDHVVRLHRRGAFATAAVLIGTADRLLSFAQDHALERKQFGRQIGSFQAVKHHLANAYVALEMARPVVYRASWSLDEEVRSAGLDCSMAKAVASEAALLAARVALQVHGAIGYTWEHDLHIWMKRAWVLADSWGDAATHFAAVLDKMVAELPELA
ncbi:MAG: acyl-CoA dehydrogenase family protein [Acidimicrobiales bacterium]